MANVAGGGASGGNLTIDTATVGYDSKGASTLLANVHAECIEEASQKLDSDYSQLESSTHQCWAGKGADTFLENVQTDIKVVKEALEKQYEILEAEINSTTAHMQNIDENLVQKR